MTEEQAAQLEGYRFASRLNVALAHCGLDVIGVEPRGEDRYKVSVYDGYRKKIWRQTIEAKPADLRSRGAMVLVTSTIQNKWFRRGEKA